MWSGRPVAEPSRCIGRQWRRLLRGGQQQQLAIARVSIRKPRLLLLDGPTEAIQPSIVVDVEELSLACGSVA